MKRRNFNKSILQQGGLMIEALAMLGLIAVVTPTMYKKSAERTMEVEDINTAATIRTINAAANDYVSANYSTILGDMVKNNETNRKLNIEDLKAYLPYGFDVKKALYNYDGEHIQLSVSRPDGSNNLTTLMLFPAKLDEENGIGQERTSRIAALIGSSGGYVTDTNKARGIGGIWELSGDSYTKNFNSANKYSIVTASADTISASAGNEMDYSKYLQRGKDPDDTGGQWKNTMRTDLYMGGPEGSSEDVYHEATGPWSIRNIKSLIVGANYGPQVTNDDGELVEAGGYGLYVTGDTNPNAYIKGSVEAGYGQLVADNGNLKYGKDAGTDDDGNSLFGFNVDTEGTITNLKNLNLAQKFANGWDSIKIGALDDNDDDDTNYIIRAYHNDNNDTGHVSLLGDNIAQFHSYGSNVYDDDDRDLVASSNDRIVLLRKGWKRLGKTTDDEQVEEPKYSTNEPYFPMRVGANAKYEGLLAAGQLDTQKIRAASLSVGSHNIDDNEKWLNVNQYGVTMADIHHENNGDYDPQGTYASFNQAGILLRADYSSHPVSDDDKGGGANYKVGGQNTSEHAIQFNLRTNKEFAGGKTLSNVAELFANNTDIRGKEIARISGQGTIIQAKSEIGDWKDDYDNNSEDETQDFKDTVASNTLLLRNDGMQMKMSSKAGSVKDKNSNDNPINISETVFSPRNNRDSAYTRTSFQKMHVDLKDSNFRIVNNLNRSVFSVRGNDNEEEKFSSNNNDVFTRNIPDLSYVKNNIANNYDVALHGNIVISPLIPNNSTGYSATNYHANVSIGTLNKNAGVNILDKRYDYYGGILSETASSGYNANQHNVVIIDQGFDENVDYNNNNKKDIVDPGTVYIRKGYVEVHGEDTAYTSGYSYNDAYHGKGVLVASRLVANNPSADKTNTTVPYGHEVPQMFDKKVMEHYGEKVENRYDTYMVNPAYTSVMHDIKLTTRGGARLSDILPDFINKGIYVVNNTYLEKTGDDLYFYGKSWSQANKGYTSSTDDLTLGSASAWASPYLGSVPAPQCPPGYGRVITLTPSVFEMGQVGNLYKGKRTDDADGKNTYYVLNSKASKGQIEAALTPAQYERTTVSPSTSSGAQVSLENDANPTLGGSYTVKSMDNISTSKYVLSHVVKEDDDHNEIQPLAPVTFQQSTHLKSLTIPLATDDGYTQGWATIMGFIYPESLYKEFLTAALEKQPVRKEVGGKVIDTKNYWNVFPVKRQSLQGYATVYCYFDRTNILDKVVKDSGFNGKQKGYIDEYTYMQSMGGNDSEDIPTSYEKKSGSTDYQKRLNDPNMKYDEVW